MPATQSPEFLSVSGLAARLGVSVRTAYNLVNDRAVPTITLRGRTRIPARALERWIVDREQEALDGVRPGGDAA